MFVSAMVAKALGASVVAAISILWLSTYEGSLGLATGIFVLYIPAVLLAHFRG
jgi:hypothetical protein